MSAPPRRPSSSSTSPSGDRPTGRHGAGSGLAATARPNSDSAVVIEPARPVEIAELILLGHGLTTREREITPWSCRGAPPPRSPPLCACRRTPCTTTSRPSSPRSGSAADNSWPPRSPDHYAFHLGRPVGPHDYSTTTTDDPGARGRAASFSQRRGAPDKERSASLPRHGGRAPTRSGSTPGWGRAVALGVFYRVAVAGGSSWARTSNSSPSATER
jgi:hypothetical protein